jgi:uncharacterized protein (TIRG00374 family)
MKFLLNSLLSLIMLALCLWLVWPAEEDKGGLYRALDSLDPRYLAGFVGLLALVHFFRAWRWNNLLAPIGVRLPPGRLLAISSVGFMAILALPARLGEFVRPALIRRRGRVSAAAALGTVAVERVVDGLFVSLVVFVAFSALRGPQAPAWMMPSAYLALAIFSAALVFLACALAWPEQTVNMAVRMTLTRHVAPRVAEVLRVKLASMIRGFLVLRDVRNLAIFCLWSLAYWVCNGLSLWVLARGFHLDLSVVGAFATMGLVAVGITLPNSPGLVGQYQWFTQLGLSLYLGREVGMHGPGLAYAIVLHGAQVVWYIGIGGLALLTPYVSLSEVWASRSLDGDGDGDGEDEDQAASAIMQPRETLSQSPEIP